MDSDLIDHPVNNVDRILLLTGRESSKGKENSISCPEFAFQIFGTDVLQDWAVPPKPEGELESAALSD